MVYIILALMVAAGLAVGLVGGGWAHSVLVASGFVVGFVVGFVTGALFCWGRTG